MRKGVDYMALARNQIQFEMEKRLLVCEDLLAYHS